MHKAKAIVIGCIDFRFRGAIDKFLQTQEFGDSYDLINIAGGSRDFISPVETADGQYVWKQLELSLKLHEPDMIVFIDHQDCGGYAQDGTIPGGLVLQEDMDKHKEFLQKLQIIVAGKYPGKILKAFHADLEGIVHILIP